MKHSKKLQACVGIVVWIIVVCMVTPLNTMISEKSTSKRYKSDVVWVKTSDGILIEVPHWQIDQMKVLQVIFVHQKGTNSKDNPVNASMITSDELVLVQKALHLTDNLEGFKEFYEKDLSQDQKVNLINGASKLDMQGLISLLMMYTFPEDVQKKIKAEQASGIIAPVIKYLKQSQILKGHTKKITCVAYSPDGNYIVSGSWDETLIIWDSKTREKIRTCTVPQGVSCVAYSPDGNYIVSGRSEDLIIRNSKTGEQIKTFKLNKLDRVECVAYSPDGKEIVSGGMEGYLIVWDSKEGKSYALSDHKKPVSCVAYSPDGKYIVSGAWDNNLIIWNNETGRKIQTLSGHKEPVTCVAYSPDGNYIVSGSYNGHLILWNGKTGEKIELMTGGHSHKVSGVGYSPDGKYIVSGSEDGNLQLWDGKTGEMIQLFKSSINSISCLAYSPDGNYIISGEYDYYAVVGESDCNLMLWKFIDRETVNYIANKLNIAQARLLYRLYVAKINNVPVVLDAQDVDYQIYLTLPQKVQKVVDAFLPFEM